MKISDPPPTLQQIVNDRIKSKGLSRHQLVQLLGYSNISKGIRKLDVYLKSLKEPNDDFVPTLLSILGIDGPTYLKAFLSSCDVLANEAKSTFTPSILISVDFQPTPFFAAQFINAQCTITVPEDIGQLPFQKELSVIFSLYNERVSNLSFKDRVTGFKYYRHFDSCMVFDETFTCKEISNPHIFSQSSRLSGNKLIATMLEGKN